jgi:tetratricopeptide (TPR) repeat protein
LEGLKFATVEPLKFLKLLFKKLFLFWNGNELSNNRDFYFFARSAPLLKLLIWRYIIYFPFGLLAPLALWGILLSHKEKKNVLILEIFLFTYLISIILFFVTARYRVPLIPIFILFSAYALDRLITKIKQKRILELGKYLGIFLIILIPINIEIPGYSSANPGRAHYTLGVAYFRKGEKIRAAEEYKKALLYNPGLAEAYVNLGSIYGDQGKHQQALECYQKALQIGSDSAFVLYNMGIEYHNQGLWDQAQKMYELSLALRDENAGAHYLLGEVYLRKEMTEKAIEEYEKTVKYDPGYAGAYYRLGTIFYQMEKREEAIKSLESFVRVWQGEADNIENVVKLLEELKNEVKR